MGNKQWNHRHRTSSSSLSDIWRHEINGNDDVDDNADENAKKRDNSINFVIVNRERQSKSTTVGRRQNYTFFSLLRAHMQLNGARISARNGDK